MGNLLYALFPQLKNHLELIMFTELKTAHKKFCYWKKYLDINNKVS